MTDPNTVYKQGYWELEAKLGRPPTTTELLPLHTAYSRAWGPAEETLVAPTKWELCPECSFERNPRTGRHRELSPTTRDCERLYPLTKPGASVEASEAESPPDAPRVNPRPADGLIVGRRGPGGGSVAACVQCGQAFERPATRGRPPARCVSCRG